jgi:hypothetical protein
MWGDAGYNGPTKRLKYIDLHFSHAWSNVERQTNGDNRDDNSKFGEFMGRYDEVIEFFSLPNPSRRTMALGSTKPLTEMSTRNLPVGKGRPARKADNLTTMSEPTV